MSHDQTAVEAWNRRVPVPPIEELAGKVPLVLYFGSREDAKEFAAVVQEAFTNPVEIRL